MQKSPEVPHAGEKWTGLPLLAFSANRIMECHPLFPRAALRIGQSLLMNTFMQQFGLGVDYSILFFISLRTFCLR
jgi:hypothetical protein